MPRSEYRQKKKTNHFTKRARILAGAFILAGLAVIGRLTILMVFKHDFYSALAKGSHEIYSKLVPERGKIYTQGVQASTKYPVAINRDYFLVFANARNIKGESQAEKAIDKVFEIISVEEIKNNKPQKDQKKDKEKQKEINDKKTESKIKKKLIEEIIQNEKDPYIPIKTKVGVKKAKKIKGLDLPGINTVRKSYRYYPEGDFAGPILGFVGRNEEGEKVGRYGAEGYWDSELSGKGGFIEGVKSASGFWIPTMSGDIKEPRDGADITLTIDRAIQYKACKKLRKAKEKYKAESASLILMNPKTGAIRAMCSQPDFNPNKYSEVETISQYNNSTIYKPYEVGSIFKPIVMAAALDKDVIEPETEFKDPGVIKDLCMTPIRNSREKQYDKTDMTGVLEKSINTGMVHVAKKLGKKDMVQYIEDFGFGTKTGVRLNTERPGDISSLYKTEGDEIGCYGATASFGQGITATPIQMVTAYSALANNGKLPRPYIVKKIEYESGKVERREPKTRNRVITEETSSLIRGMLTSVVKQGHAATAGEQGYYVAGKTGTAQISGKTGGYSEDTNHSFVGFAPSNDPKFVLLVKFHKPDRRFSASTAAPTFGKITDFLLDYYQIPPSKK
ncbi:MAG: peptidoglycan D,D-transpeptidase FtsI family protein [Candidatus Magasanikbacteria bacterium]